MSRSEIMGGSILKFVIFVALAIFSWWFAVESNADGFFAVSAVALATGIIVWKLDKIERLLKEKKPDSDSESKNS